MSSEPEPEPEPEPELSSELEPELSSKLSESSEVEEDELVEALEDDRDEVLDDDPVVLEDEVLDDDPVVLEDEVLDDDPVVLEDEALVLDEVEVRGRSPPLSSAVPAGVLDELLTSCTEAGTAVGNDWANDSLPSNPRAAGTTAAVAAIAITMRFMVGSLQVVGRGGPATTQRCARSAGSRHRALVVVPTQRYAATQPSAGSDGFQDQRVAVVNRV